MIASSTVQTAAAMAPEEQAEKLFSSLYIVNQDFKVTLAICCAVLLGICAVGFCIYKIVRECNRLKKIEAEEQRKQELDKLKLELSHKKTKERYDSAWRFVEHYWKIEANKEVDADTRKFTADMAAEARAYLSGLWKPETPSGKTEN